MAQYGSYVDPFEPGSRGIERLSVVYGIVPVHEDGRPYKQYKFPGGDSGEHPDADTPRKVAKGLVEKIEASHEQGLFRDVKVSWQSQPLGRAALSRGVSRWPASAAIFTAGEIAGAAASDVIEADVNGHEIAAFGRSLILPASEGLAGQVDELVESELGNAMLRGLLASHYEARYATARAIFKEEVFDPAMEAYRAGVRG